MRLFTSLPTTLGLVYALQQDIIHAKNPPPPSVPGFALIEPAFEAARDISPPPTQTNKKDNLDHNTRQSNRLRTEDDTTTLVVSIRTRKTTKRRRHRTRHPKRRKPNPPKDIPLVLPPPQMRIVDDKAVRQYWTRLREAQPPLAIPPPVYMPSNVHQFKFI